MTGLVDEVSGARPVGLPLSTGTYLALAALNRVVAPCSKLGFADWWKTTAADRFTKIQASALDHRRFWNAMHAVNLDQLEEISQAIALRIVDLSGLGCSSVALDMTNFATFIDTGNDKAPIVQRGKTKQKRSDLRLVGLGVVVTRDGGIPLSWHAYPGDRPDVTQFASMISQLGERHAGVCAAAGQQHADMTVVFDAGQNSEDNFAHLAETGLHYVGSVPASDCPDLTALPASARVLVEEERFGGLTAFDTRRMVYGTERRAILIHSPELHESQACGFEGTTLAKAGQKLASWPPPSPAAKPAGHGQGGIRDHRDHPQTLGAAGAHLAAHRRQPRDLRLTWSLDEQARAALEEELFGKHVLITDHDDWPVPDVISAYRSQSEAEFSFRQLKDPGSSPSARCSTGPSTTSASTPSPACLPCRSPT